jgi:hypothetical protein
MPTRDQAISTPAADRGLLPAWRRLTQSRAALIALAATAALGAAASSASAAEWGYEQISPTDSASIGVFAIAASKDMSTAVARTRTVPMVGMPTDGRSIVYTYGLPRGGSPWAVGATDWFNGPQLATYVLAVSADGSRMLYSGQMPSVDGAGSGVYRVDAHGAAESMTFGPGGGTFFGATSENLDALAFSGPASADVFVGKPGQAPVRVSVDNDGNPMVASGPGGAAGTAKVPFAANALAANGSSVIFMSSSGIPGDNDGGAKDVFMRILTPGAEKTIAISDATDNGDPDAPAGDASSEPEYRWATPDHDRVFFVSRESLEPGDTDTEQDVYMRAGTDAPVRISQGEVVDGSPTGNASNPEGSTIDWAMSSQDGNRTYFVSPERLTQDAPADGPKLYERDVAEGRTRLVAGPLDEYDIGGTDDAGLPEEGRILARGVRDLSLRGIRVTPQGVVFMSKTPFAGSPADTESSVFMWTRDGGLVQIGKPDADAPASPTGPASILAHNSSGEQLGASNELAPIRGGRGVSDDGSQVFFWTGQSLTAQDTDGGYSDVYRWTKGEGVRLVTPPGREPYEAGYIDNSADGTKVYFNTSEGVLSSDADPNASDVYLAILGGGSSPSKPAPDADPKVCTGEACQGPIAGPVAPPSIGSVGFAGPGNVAASPDPVAPSVVVSKLDAVTGSVATLKVKVPDAGQISATGASLRSASVSAAKAGSYSVRIALSSAAKKSLKRKKTLKVSVRVAYRANDGESVSKTVSVTFKQPKAKPAKTKMKGGR